MLFSILSIVPWTSTSFTLKLIHRDSPLSPLYQSNLSDFERFMTNIEISKARASNLERPSEVMGAKLIQHTSKFHESMFTVEIGIGTPAVKKTLIFDTGSGLTWTQCSPCTKCFKQNEPLFIRNMSSSYEVLTKNHPLAKSKSIKCGSLRGGCFYNYSKSFVSGQSSAGVASTDSFTFDTNTTIPYLVFGCGTRTIGHFSQKISGILGFNREPTSFAMQLMFMWKGRFSYCMSSQNNQGAYVTLGDKVKIRGRNLLGERKWVRMSLNRKSQQYQLMTLIDITLNGLKLNLGAAAFGKSLYIDSSIPFTLLHRTAFSALKYMLDKYFDMFKNFKPYVGNKNPKGLVCYTETPKLTELPDMQLNFIYNDFLIPNKNMFMYIDNNTFCLAMTESKRVTVLGAYQQRNYLFLYNLENMTFSYIEKDCSIYASS